MGRPEKVSEDEVAELAFQGCQTATIARLLGVDESTIRKRFPELLKKKRAERKQALRNRQWQLLMSDDAPSARTMAIWLGKNELGQADKSEVRQDITAKVYGKQFDLDAVAGKDSD